jgi:hypothetical protein
MSLVSDLASSFEHYLTLERVDPTRTYDYPKHGYGFPIIDVTRYGEKCKKGESWLYLAAPIEARLKCLAANEKLYVGAQTQDRMFRGSGQGGNNYHHNEMRKGNGTDNPISFLRSGQQAAIYRISAAAIERQVSSRSELAFLLPLLRQPRTPKRHVGWWFEQFILFEEPGTWRWNTDPADRAIVQAFR